MLHADHFARMPKYRKKHFTTNEQDRPLFVQFCANDPDVLLEAARLVEDSCDAVDINLGCPQGIAKRGRYGAWLMDDLPLIRSMVVKLHENLSIPVTCKIRCFPKVEDTVAYALMLQDAGCQLLTVHGRTRDIKGPRYAPAQWDQIKAVKEALSIPVYANGNVGCLDDANRCMEYTGCDGVMSAEALLWNPALFNPSHSAKQPDSAALLLEYLDIAEKYNEPMSIVRSHVHRMMIDWFTAHPYLREIALERNGKSTHLCFSDTLRS
eukprot:scaffold3605_cov430-Prasinococcus_capsulatus_cf.AAC.3